MRFVYNDGGRKDAGFRGRARDCACRAIAIAAQIPYAQVQNLIYRAASHERIGKRKRTISDPNFGVYHATMRKIMDSLGWAWYATSGIGKGCLVHMREDELPAGRLIVSVSRHYSVVIDGTIHDLFDCSRYGTRCVYGYWTKERK